MSPFLAIFFCSGGGGGVLGEIRQGRVLEKVCHGAKVY